MTYDGTLVMPKNCAPMTTDEMTYVEGGGFVGFHLKLSASGRAATVAAIAATVGYIVARATAPLVAAGPWGVVAAGVITVAAAGTAAYLAAQLKAGKTYSIGVYINGYSWSRSITF